MIHGKGDGNFTSTVSVSGNVSVGSEPLNFRRVWAINGTRVKLWAKNTVATERFPLAPCRLVGYGRHNTRISCEVCPATKRVNGATRLIIT